MFRGHVVHTIDAKGRISMPSRFREQLAGASDRRIILTTDPFDPCLHLFPLAAWEEIEKKISELPKFAPHVVRLRRVYVSAAEECELDRSGRLLVSPHFREHAKLQKEVLWAGNLTKIELWSKDLWDAGLSVGADDQMAFREAVAELI